MFVNKWNPGHNELKFFFQGKQIALCTWPHVPRVGEGVDIEGRVYTVKTIWHCMSNQNPFDTAIEVHLKEQ